MNQLIERKKIEEINGTELRKYSFFNGKKHTIMVGDKKVAEKVGIEEAREIYREKKKKLQKGGN